MARVMAARDVLRIRATRPEGRFRAGRFWPAEGAIIAMADLDEDAQAAILADPYLKVEPAEAGAEDAAEADAAVRAEIAGAIAGLPPEAFDAHGRPKLDALRAALPNVKVTAALRDEVWAGAKAAAAD